MKAPSKVIQELSDKSLASGQSVQEWLDYLEDLRMEIETLIPSVKKDVEFQQSNKKV